MWGLLLKKILRYLSVHFLYLKWTHTLAALLVFWALYLVDAGWFAQTGLTIILPGLLAGGILLLVIGMRDLVRDFWHFLHRHSH